MRVSESEDSLNSSTWSWESGTGTWWASLGRFYVSTGKWTRDSDADVASWRQVLKCFLNLHLQAHGGQAPVVTQPLLRLRLCQLVQKFVYAARDQDLSQGL